MFKRIIAHIFGKRNDPIRQASRWYWRQVAADPVYVAGVRRWQ